jgi:hypothetical protein
MKLPFERRAVEALAAIPDPRESEQWFRNLPPDRREQMTREQQERMQRGLQHEIEECQRTLAEAASMGGNFMIADIFCPGGGALTALLSLALGAGVGYFCNRLEAHLLLTALLGMFIFLGSQYVFLGGLGWMHLGACFPLGAACALLGFQREQRRSL